jgi:hypothetical protein
MTLTLPLFFIKRVNLSVKQGSAMLLTIKLSSFQPAPSNHLALRLSERCANAQTIRALGLFFWTNGGPECSMPIRLVAKATF